MATAMAEWSGKQAAGRGSGKAGQFSWRALGNMAPRTTLPVVVVEGIVRPWYLGSAGGGGGAGGGGSWRLFLGGLRWGPTWRGFAGKGVC